MSRSGCGSNGDRGRADVIAKEAPGVLEVRALFDRTRSAAAVLKVLAGSGTGQVLDWAKQMRAAFDLSLAEVKPIGGWSPDGSGELDDGRLDALLVPAIESRRGSWESR